MWGGVVVALLKLAVSPDDEEFNSRVVAYNGCEYVSGMDFCVWHDKLLGCEAACCDVGFVPPPTDVYRKVLAASRDLKFEMQVIQYELDMRRENGAKPGVDMPALVALLSEKQRKLNKSNPNKPAPTPAKVRAARVPASVPASSRSGASVSRIADTSMR